MATDEAENEPSTLLEVRCVLNAMRRQVAGRLRVVGVCAHPEGRLKWNTGEALVCNFEFHSTRCVELSPASGYFQAIRIVNNYSPSKREAH